jgi:purine-binding chemotaxis protein CheW
MLGSHGSARGVTVQQSMGDGGRALLLCRVGGLWCGFPLEDVSEIMRPLPSKPLKGAPSFVRGVAFIRSRATPVVDGALLLNGLEGSAASRFVVLRLGQRQVAVAVDTVDDVRRIDSSAVLPLPALLAGAPREFIQGIGALDRELLLVLERSHRIPEAVWPTLGAFWEGAGAP